MSVKEYLSLFISNSRKNALYDRAIYMLMTNEWSM